MASSRNAVDWDQLRPRILRDLANGKTQQQIRQRLAEDPFRLSISKSQLETQLKRWKYRNSLHEPEWKVVSHLINKRRKAGKQTSQVLVNGFIFNERKVAKAMSRYDTPTLAYRLPPPQIPPELSHHLIEVRTPPPSHRFLQLPPPRETMTQARREGLAPHLTSSGSVWPRTAQWTKVKLSVDQFVARFFLPTYEQDGNFRDAFNMFGRKLPLSRAHRGKEPPTTSASCETSLPAQAWDPVKDPHDGVLLNQNEVQRSSSGSHIHTAVVQTLVGLLYGLSNQSLDYIGRQALSSMMEAPTWDTVLPRLRDVLAVVDSKIVQAIAEGLFKESIHELNQNMLDLSLGLGADPTHPIRSFDRYKRRDVLSTPLAVICGQFTETSGKRGARHSPERLILSLLKRDPRVSNSALLWIIGANCHAIAEDLIHSQPHRAIDFSIAVSDLGGAIWPNLLGFRSLTPLVVACSGRRQSAERLSLIRCLLERNAKADLQAMLAAARACDGKVISLLYKHGAPVDGFIPYLGSPLSCACDTIARSPLGNTDITVIPLLLRLGAPPNNPKTQELNKWGFSSLHLLAVSEERPEVTEALDLLLKHGADINNRSGLYPLHGLTAYSRSHGPLDQTALECAIRCSRWISAIQFLSADCELTGRELFFISSTNIHHVNLQRESEQKPLKKFIGLLLEKAPDQATALHWNGLTALQTAIRNDYGYMILALFAFGVTPTPSDFLHMLRNRANGRANVCSLSGSIQMKLAVDSRLSEPPITDTPTLRLILAYACPEVVRRILDGCPDFYDSEGLCFVIARLVSEDRIYYSDFPDQAYDEGADHRPDSLTMDDLHAFISRRTPFNRHRDWESTAVTMAARAGRADVLKILIEFGQEELRSSGLIPSFLLSKFLMGARDMPCPLAICRIVNDLDWGLLGVWIKYCRMDDPNMRCSPLTAAAMVVSETAAEEVFDLLLALHYQPDCWTVLVASSQGRLSILQRLKRLECWPHFVNHTDRPDWCPTALQTAVCNAHVSTVRFLLDTGAMVNTMDLSPRRPFCFFLPGVPTPGIPQIILPRTALQHAVEQENMELVILLVNAGADVNAPASTDSGATALQIASIQGSIPMVQYLISQGADLHAAGAAKHGRTALQGAAEYGRKDVIELLLSHGALTGYWYREQLVEAILYAEKNAHHVVAGILRERMLPPWSTEDEETFEMLQEDWETASGHSAFDDLRDKLDAWEEAVEDWPESVQAYQTSSNCDRASEQPRIEDSLAFQVNGSWFLQEMEFGLDGREGVDAGQIRENNLYDCDVVSTLALQEDTAAWVEGQLSLGGYGVDDMLLGDFSFGSFI